MSNKTQIPWSLFSGNMENNKLSVVDKMLLFFTFNCNACNALYIFKTTWGLRNYTTCIFVWTYTSKVNSISKMNLDNLFFTQSLVCRGGSIIGLTCFGPLAWMWKPVFWGLNVQSVKPNAHALLTCMIPDK